MEVNFNEMRKKAVSKFIVSFEQSAKDNYKDLIDNGISEDSAKNSALIASHTTLTYQVIEEMFEEYHRMLMDYLDKK